MAKIRNNWYLVLLILTTWCADISCSPQLTHSAYACGRYTANIEFLTFSRTIDGENNQVLRTFGMEYGNAMSRIGSPIASSGAPLRDCSDSSYYCLKEVDGNRQFIYAVPHIVRAPGIFAKEGRECNVALYYGYTPNGTGVVEIWSRDAKGDRYKYLLKGGVGLYFLHYARLDAVGLSDGAALLY